jgi:hypothetical protein
MMRVLLFAAAAEAFVALPDAGCQILKDKDTEKQAVEAICERQKKVPKIECVVGLHKIWDQITEKECPKAVSALPDVACDILKDQDKEKVAVEMICEKQTKVPKDECEAGLSKIWEMVAEKECPNASHVDSLFV